MVALLKMPKSFMSMVNNDDRRAFQRKEVQAQVEGQRLDHTITALQQPHLKLSLRDLSFGGMSALSDKPLAAGERVAVFFQSNGPSNGSSGGWDAHGRVLRCDQAALGYRIAVEFDPLPAA